MNFTKKKKILVFAGLLMLVASIYSWPALTAYWDGYYQNVLVKGTLQVNTTVTLPTGGVSAGEIANAERYVPLPLAGFCTATPNDITTSTSPGWEIDDSVLSMVWADGETTAALVSFRIPSDYASGGAFKVFATESDSTTPNQVDFDVYVNADNAAADASATNQTPVALDQTGGTSTGCEVTLMVSTDFASLAAGNWVTLRIWRDDTATGTGDLEVKGVSFYYTATQ